MKYADINSKNRDYEFEDGACADTGAPLAFRDERRGLLNEAREGRIMKRVFLNPEGIELEDDD